MAGQLADLPQGAVVGSVPRCAAAPAMGVSPPRICQLVEFRGNRANPDEESSRNGRWAHATFFGDGWLETA